MTDRVNGFLVTLAKDMRIDDAESLMNAIRLIVGVANVEPIVEDFAHRLAVNQAKTQLRDKIGKLLWED